MMTLPHPVRPGPGQVTLSCRWLHCVEHFTIRTRLAATSLGALSSQDTMGDTMGEGVETMVVTLSARDAVDGEPLQLRVQVP